MSGHRLLAVAGAVVFGLVLVATPAAAAEPTVKWTRPTVDDAVITAPGPIKGTVSTNEADSLFIKELQFELVQPDETRADCRVGIHEDDRAQRFDDPPTSVDFEVPVQFRCNGPYTLNLKVVYEERLLNVPITTKESTANLAFKVAIPPAQVAGLKATYDPASKNVGLSWKPNTEADLAGYRVMRNPPGPAGFETVAPLVKEPTFTDPGIEAEHRYQVIAVRAGPDGRNIEGKPSTVVTAGPRAPQPTAPQVGPPNQRRPATTATATAGNRPTVRKRTATTVDTGFSRDLPFDPSETTTTQVPTTSTEPPGQAAVLAEFDDDDGDDDDRRATLVPVAGGLALLMSAVHMRLLSNRVGDDDIPILPGD